MSTYRPNVAVLVTDGHGQVLLCYRADGSSRPIQTVQGGIDPGETPEQAAIREVEEEIGLQPKDFRMLASSHKKYRYRWSKPIIDEATGQKFIGQEQQFFLIEVDPKTEFTLDAHHREFSKVRWGTPEEFVELIWEPKRAGLEASLKEFGLLST